jgi:hypothetical protein
MGRHDEARRVAVFATGLARPADSDVTGGDALWVLDLKCVTAKERDRLELSLFGALTSALDVLAHVWDASSGRGVLGLRHVQHAARDVLAGARRRRVGALCREIVSCSERKLESLRTARGWEARPRVLSLDL